MNLKKITIYLRYKNEFTIKKIHAKQHLMITKVFHIINSLLQTLSLIYLMLSFYTYFSRKESEDPHYYNIEDLPRFLPTESTDPYLNESFVSTPEVT